MKQKLKIYRSLLILIVVIIFTIILYYFRYFYLASTILIVYLAFKEYLNIENEIQNEKMNTLTDEIKANINDNISRECSTITSLPELKIISESVNKKLFSSIEFMNGIIILSLSIKSENVSQKCMMLLRPDKMLSSLQ